jgi:glycosyltransferase involved in cell wall biosynthesis/Flp pilus assembly protein TadD
LPTLGLAMIVKNGAQTLRNCLESVQGIVDTIVIGDTGSTDETVAIAQEFGATILPMSWIDDFAQARNTVLEHMQTDWVLSLDADEAVAEGSAAWIRNAIADESVAAYHIQLRNYISPRLMAPIDQIMLNPDEVPAYAPDTVAYGRSAAMRLFRRDPEVYFVGCVHEMVEYRILELRRPFRAGGFLIHHFGWYLQTAERSKEKRDLYFALMGKKLQEMPNDTNSMVRYGYMLYDDYQKPQEALAMMKRALEINPRTPCAWLWTSLILTKLRRYEDALLALDLVPAEDNPNLRTHLIADCLLALGRLPEALTAYETALLVAPYDRVVRSKLGLTEVRLGRTREGLDRIRAAVGGTPAIEAAEQIFVSALIAAGQIDQALVEGELFAQRYKRVDAWLEVVQTHAHRGNWPLALQAVNTALEQRPDAVELHEFRLTATLALNDWPQAAVAARRVADLAPSPETLLRLATILHHLGDQAESQRILAIRDSVFVPSPEQVEMASA